MWDVLIQLLGLVLFLNPDCRIKYKHNLKGEDLYKNDKENKLRHCPVSNDLQAIVKEGMPSVVYLNDALESPVSGDFGEHRIDFCSSIKLLALQMVFFEIINTAMCSMRMK